MTCSTLDVDVGGLPAGRHDQRRASTTSPTSQGFSPTITEGLPARRRAGSPRSHSATAPRVRRKRRTRCRGPRRSCDTSTARPGARAAASRSSTRSRPTATTRSGSCCTRSASGRLYGSTARGEQIEVSINGERVALLDIDHRMSEADPNGHEPDDAARARQARARSACRGGVHPAVRRAGRRPAWRRSNTRSPTPDRRVGYGITTLPHLRDFSITGPFTVDRRFRHAEPPEDLHAAGRRSPDEEAPCARDPRRGSRARRTAGRSPGGDIEPLMKFFDDGPQGAAGSRQASAWRSQRDSGQPALPVPPRGSARRRARPGRTYRDRRSSTGVAAVVLPVGHAPDADC